MAIAREVEALAATVPAAAKVAASEAIARVAVASAEDVPAKAAEDAPVVDLAAAQAAAVLRSLKKPSRPRTTNANNGIVSSKQTQSAKKIKKTTTARKTVKAWTAGQGGASPQNAPCLCAFSRR